MLQSDKPILFHLQGGKLMVTFCPDGVALLSRAHKGLGVSAIIPHLGDCEMCEDALADLYEQAGMPSRRSVWVSIRESPNHEKSGFRVSAPSRRRLRILLPARAWTMALPPGCTMSILAGNHSFHGITTEERLRQVAAIL